VSREVKTANSPVRYGGLRSRVRRFESCWGAPPVHLRKAVLTSTDAIQRGSLALPPSATPGRHPPGSSLASPRTGSVSEPTQCRLRPGADAGEDRKQRSQTVITPGIAAQRLIPGGIPGERRSHFLGSQSRARTLRQQRKAEPRVQGGPDRAGQPRGPRRQGSVPCVKRLVAVGRYVGRRVRSAGKWRSRLPGSGG
jgi:hypothetical protein